MLIRPHFPCHLWTSSLQTCLELSTITNFYSWVKRMTFPLCFSVLTLQRVSFLMELYCILMQVPHTHDKMKMEPMHLDKTVAVPCWDVFSWLFKDSCWICTVSFCGCISQLWFLISCMFGWVVHLNQIQYPAIGWCEHPIQGSLMSNCFF